MASEPPNLIWNETYSSKYIPVKVCTSPSIFVNLSSKIKDPLTTLPLSIRNKNKGAALLNAQVKDPSLKWEDTYSNTTNCSPCYVPVCPTPVITVNTTNCSDSGNENGYQLNKEIICSNFICTNDVSGDSGIFINPKIKPDTTPKLTLKYKNNNGTILNSCHLECYNSITKCSSLKLTNKNEVMVDIGGDTTGHGSIKLTGYLEVGSGANLLPNYNNVGYCIPSFFNGSTSLNKPLDTIIYRTSDGYNVNTILSYLNTPTQNGIIYGYNISDTGYIPIIIRSDGTYNVQCNLSIQQSNSYTNDLPPTIEFIIGYYNLNTTDFNLISNTPTRMTLTSYTSPSTNITQYNYSSGSSIGLLISNRNTFPSAINGQIFIYAYQFVENISSTPGRIIPNLGSGLSINTIPSFVITKLT